VLKRIALLLAAVATLALASVALGAAQQWAGRFDDGGTVAFKLTIPAKGEQRKVKAWEWSNFRIRCRNGKHKYDGKFTNDVDPALVEPKGQTFSIEAENSWGGTATVAGTFDTEYTKATGTFRVRGRTSVGRRCRGESDWTAFPPPVS
jgi:hypothetical protein